MTNRTRGEWVSRWPSMAATPATRTATIVRYDWDFGDGSIANDAGATPTNVYATGGKYIARLTVTDDSGETDTDITVVNVGIGNLPPQADAGDVSQRKGGSCNHLRRHRFQRPGWLRRQLRLELR